MGEADQRSNPKELNLLFWDKLGEEEVLLALSLALVANYPTIVAKCKEWAV